RSSELVEGEDVKAADVQVGPGQSGSDAEDQPIGVEAPRLEHPPEPAGVAAQEPRRLPDPVLRVDAQQLGRVRDPELADVDRQLVASVPDSSDPAGYDLGVEAEVADDVGCGSPLVPHGLNGEVVV